MESQNYYNPYAGQTFLGFFWELLVRLWLFLKGDLTLDMLASDEIQIVVLMGVACSSALVGSFLVLKKMTMLANSISHTILVGVVIAFLWTQAGQADLLHRHELEGINTGAMLVAALVVGLLTAFLTELFTKWIRLQEDASTGLVFTSLFAVGVIALTVLMRNAHVSTEVVMGNVDALQRIDLDLVYYIFGVNVVLFVLFFKEFKITTFDPGLSRALGISVTFFGYLLMAQVSATAIGAFRAVGVLLVLAFMTGPPLIARLLTNDLKKMLLLTMLMGSVASVVGVALARHMLSVYGMPLSTAGVVVCVILLMYVGVACFRARKWTWT